MLEGKSSLSLQHIWDLLRSTAIEWQANKAQRLSAALAYYTMFSLAPLLVILLALAGELWGEKVAESDLIAEIGTLLGNQSADAVRQLIAGVRAPSSSNLTVAIGAVALVFGASAMFNHLKDSLNTIWGVARKPGHVIVGFLMDRILAFVMVVLAACVSLISFAVGLGLTRLSATLADQALGIPPASMMGLAGAAISFVVVTMLLGPLYKFLPDTTIAWRDVWVGAAMTAALLVAGQLLIGFYLRYSPIGSAYGVVGAIVVLLVWVYYSAMIFFFGAEFTWVYANRFGSRVIPASHAVPLTVEARALQGMLRAHEIAEVAREQSEQVDGEAAGA
jgi:membrane protein